MGFAPTSDTRYQRSATQFFPLDAFDVDHHHWLVVGVAVLGYAGGEYSVHFELLPRRGVRRNWRAGLGGRKEILEVLL